MDNNIASIRKDYILKSLNEDEVDANPLQQFNTWWDEAVASALPELNAMTLATVDASGNPSARIVLLKAYNNEGFSFFTNYNSAKANDIAANENVALLFFWTELERQVRIEGVAKKLDAQQSDIYFSSRPVGSRIGAWASPQSKVIESRKVLEANAEKYITEFGEAVPRPPHWGGYIVKSKRIEFWQGAATVYTIGLYILKLKTDGKLKD